MQKTPIAGNCLKRVFEIIDFLLFYMQKNITFETIYSIYCLFVSFQEGKKK